eukprot:scaffold58223_cov34-Attheya_sp.AAC.7
MAIEPSQSRSVRTTPVVNRGGCGACGKGRNGGKWDETVFWGNTKPVVERDEWLEKRQNCLLGQYKASGGGVWRSTRLGKEGGGLNEEEDNWSRLQGRRSQRGGVGGYYLILDIGV